MKFSLKSIYRGFTGLFFATFLLFSITSCGQAKEVPYTEIQKGTDKETVIEQLGGKANKVEDEDGIEAYQYTNSVYLDYHGKMTYYFSEDVLAFSKWEYTNDDKDELEKVAKDILKNLEKEYGTGEKTEDTTGTMEIWTLDSKTVNYVYNHTDDLGYTITITIME